MPVIKQKKDMRIIEICGLPGSGKSTVCQLVSQDHNIQYNYRLKAMAKLYYLFLYLPKYLYMTLHAGTEKHSWKKLRLLFYLDILMSDLEIQMVKRSGTVMIDQGPIFINATLEAKSDTYGAQFVMPEWSNHHIRRWANMLDGIVWLDASDLTLLSRVFERRKKHYLKTVNKKNRQGFIKSYKLAYIRILTECERLGVPILRILTDEISIQDTVIKVRRFAAANGITECLHE